MPSISVSDDLVLENQQLLDELTHAYENLEVLLAHANAEKAIAYRELQERVEALEELHRELSRKENHLVHLEKLSSIGEFMAEIIHELKSPLTAIAAHADLILMEDISDDVRNDAAQIRKQTDRMNGYLGRFMKMAYRGEESYTIWDLNEVLSEALSTLEILKPNKVELVSHFAEEPLLVRGDPEQVAQIVLNLGRNAFDAMTQTLNGPAGAGKAERRGRLEVTTSKLTADGVRSQAERFSCQSPKAWEEIVGRHDAFAVAVFKDTGVGIPEDKLPYIFQPFFTTKGKGRGTGLGLSITSDIVKRHRGNLSVESKVGEGAAFWLYLPIADGTESVSNKQADAAGTLTFKANDEGSSF